jgi:hypothetical protein
VAVLENPRACPCVAVRFLHLRAQCRADDRVSVRLRTLYGGSHSSVAHIERHSCVRVRVKLRALQVDVPDVFLENRNDSPAQSRDPL